MPGAATVLCGATRRPALDGNLTLENGHLFQWRVLGSHVVIGGYIIARIRTMIDHARNGKDSTITGLIGILPTFATTNSRSPMGG